MSDPEQADPPLDVDRRTVLSGVTTVAMAGGIATGYGAFAALCARYLYPDPGEARWVFVMELARLKAGGSLAYRTPAGAPVTIARREERGEAEDFVALSSTCPHLGCQVHWESAHQRFFCPCHNGTFDAAGKATGGPPAEAGQSLPRYPLRIENGMVFIGLPEAALKETT